METKTVPLQLEQSPIIEAVWQIRFDVANDIAVGDFRIESTPVQIRAEVAEAEYIHTIQIINQAQLTQPSVEQDSAGIIIDIDTTSKKKQYSLSPL